MHHELHGREIPQSRMHSFSVIEYFNVGKEALAELVLIPVLGAINPLGFQGLEKCLCHGVLVQRELENSSV